MGFCEKCKMKMAESELNARHPFPAFALLGGVLGAAGAVATGALLLVPAGVIAGVVADRHRCENCGDEVEEDAPSYELMEAREDEWGKALFARADLAGRQTGEDPFAKDRPGSTESSMRGEESEWEVPDRTEGPPPREEHKEQPEPISYRYDDFKKMLVPLDPAQSEADSGVEFGWSVGPEFDLGGQQIGVRDQGPSRPCGTPDAGDEADMGPSEPDRMPPSGSSGGGEF